MRSLEKVSLAFETSSVCSSIGIQKAGQWHWVLKPEITVHNRRDPVVFLNQFFAEGDLSLDQIDQLLVSEGPGHYTGLRVGLACVQAMACTRNLPIVVFPSTLALAQSWYQDHLDFKGEIGVFLDARAELVIGQRYRILANRLEPLEEPSCQSAQSFLSTWNSSVFLVGSGYSRWQDLCYQYHFEGELVYPQASALVALWHQGQGRQVSPEQLVPVYARDPV